MLAVDAEGIIQKTEWRTFQSRAKNLYRTDTFVSYLKAQCINLVLACWDCFQQIRAFSFKVCRNEAPKTDESPQPFSRISSLYQEIETIEWHAHNGEVTSVGTSIFYYSGLCIRMIRSSGRSRN